MNNQKRKCNELEDKTQQFISLVNTLNEDEFVNFLTNEAKEYVVVTDNESKIGYVWNENEKLWKRLYFETMAIRLRDYWFVFIDACLELLNDKLQNNQLDKNDIESVNSNIKRLQQFKTKTQNLMVMKKIFNDVISKFENDGFLLKLNTKTSLLPIQHHQVINLKTKQVRPRTKHDMFSFECPVTFIEKYNENTYQVAETYMKSVCHGNVEYVKYLQKLFGYCLTGEMSECSMYHLYGPSRSGKTTLCQIFRRIFGKNHSHVINLQEMLIKTGMSLSQQQIQKKMIYTRFAMKYGVDMIKFKRIANMVVTESINSNEPSKYRMISYLPICKYFLIGNEKPIIIENNEHINMNVQFVKYLPFWATFEENDSNEQYINELQTTHLSELFSFFVQGAFEWYQTKQLIAPSFCNNICDSI